MKNILRYGLYGIIAAMSLASVSCTDEYEYDPAAPAVTDNAKAQISAESTDFTFEGDEKQEFTFKVTRPDSKDAATVALECNNPKVTVPATVDFAVGEAEKEVTATADLDLDEHANVTIKVADKDADIYNANGGYYQQSFTLFRDYEWTDAGTCTFVDYTFSQGTKGARGVKIQKHPKETNKYRIVKPFVYTYGLENSGDIVFYLNDDGSADTLEGGTIKLGFPYQKYTLDLTYYTSGSYANSCAFLNDGNTYEIDMLLTNSGTPFAYATYLFQWDEGWPGKTAE